MIIFNVTSPSRLNSPRLNTSRKRSMMLAHHVIGLVFQNCLTDGQYWRSLFITLFSPTVVAFHPLRTTPLIPYDGNIRCSLFPIDSHQNTLAQGKKKSVYSKMFTYSLFINIFFLTSRNFWLEVDWLYEYDGNI